MNSKGFVICQEESNNSFGKIHFLIDQSASSGSTAPAKPHISLSWNHMFMWFFFFLWIIK
jgi:hypothetical protein